MHEDAKVKRWIINKIQQVKSEVKEHKTTATGMWDGEKEYRNSGQFREGRGPEKIQVSGWKIAKNIEHGWSWCK